MATKKQVQKILFLFESMPIDQIKAMLESGALADLRDANYQLFNRDAHRKACGLLPITNDLHIIDCDAKPFVPLNTVVYSHKKGGRLAFDASKITLYLSEKQQDFGGVIQGHELLGEVAKKSPLNACVLDYLIDHKELIPKSWKDKRVYFFGTVYLHSLGYRCVRYLGWNGEWYSSWDWLVFDWNASDHVALRAS